MSTTQSSSSGDGKAAKKESPKSTSTTESKSDSSAASSGGGKSTRDSIGGSKEVHYGYFSSVRTPEYRSGWDDIWGKKSKKKSAPKSRAKTKGPVDLDLEFDKLPADLRDGLMEHARKKLHRTPAGFKKLQEAGDIEWT
ncbi:MAG: hypothetical protein HOK54_23645, partial [Alphaproteobacteria bacterium]|nr:hypothetical protein [Alphaproteobacteria bacterium]